VSVIDASDTLAMVKVPAWPVIETNLTGLEALAQEAAQL